MTPRVVGGAMRAAAAGLVLLFLLPTVLAAERFEHTYVVALNGNGGGGELIRNGNSYGPLPGHTNVTVEVDDVSGGAVFIRVCHEWTFNDGSHAQNRCSRVCATTFTGPMYYPPYPNWWEEGGVTYRVIVTLDNPSIACQEALAGTMAVTFT